MVMINNLPAFLVAAFLLNIAPGPDQADILSRTLAQGRFVGLVSSWGVCSGAMIHVVAAALGFSLILQSSPTAYALLKYAGAAWLLWLGFKSFRRETFQINADTAASGRPPLGRIYAQGIMVDLLNPKVALFFLAFLPQFIPAESPQRTALFVALGGAVVAMSLICEAALIVVSQRILGKSLQNSRAAAYLNYLMGLVFVALAVNLALAA